MKSLVRCLMVFFCLFLASFLFLSCASKPKFSGQADLCGLVVDENNNPVPVCVCLFSASRRRTQNQR